MTGKTLKELNVQVGDVVEHDTMPGIPVTFMEPVKSADFMDVRGHTWNGDAPGWSVISRATPEPVSEPSIDLSTLSRDQLEELRQQVAVELEKKPEVVTERLDVFYNSGFGVAGTAGAAWPATHRITFTITDKKLGAGTYISSDGNEIKVEEV